jgi:hypothetical protein
LHLLLSKAHTDRVEGLYPHADSGRLRNTDLSTIFNFSTEVFHSCRTLLLAAADYLLNDSRQIESFDKTVT